MWLKTGLSILEKEEITWINMSILSVVATPIGNLEDISLRALRVFKEADLILCEDTRVAKKLLSHYEINTSVLSYHQHSGILKIEKILEELKSGKNLVLISDAGTPGISDPGSMLISSIRKDLPETEIVAIPGPSALGAALSLAGIGFDRFVFWGFLPHKKGRQTAVSSIVSSDMPYVLYESKHRIIKLLKELSIKSKELEKEKEVLVFREITKMHESYYQGKPLEVLQTLESDPNNLKGEFVVLVKNLT